MKSTVLHLNLYNHLLCEAVAHQKHEGGFLTLLAVDRNSNYPYQTGVLLMAEYAVFNAKGKPQIFTVRNEQLDAIVEPVSVTNFTGIPEQKPVNEWDVENWTDWAEKHNVSYEVMNNIFTKIPESDWAEVVTHMENHSAWHTIIQPRVADDIMPDPFGTEELDEFLTPSQADEDRVIWSMDCDDAQSKLASLQGPMFKIVAERSSESIAEILVNWLNQHNINWTRDIQRATLDIHNGKPRMAMNPEWVVNIKPLSTLIYSLSSLLCSHRQYLLKRLDWDDYTH